MRGRVITKIYGGLGNQLFQYAAGRALSIRSDSSLLLDRRFFDHSKTAEFGLNHFNVGRATEAIGQLPPQRKGQRLRHYLWRRLNLSPKLVRETGLSFDERLLQPLTNVFLDGYWQSERYFSDVADNIREDLKIVTPPNFENARILEEITSQSAVSLHVRRGDYLLPQVQAIYGSCTGDFYSSAVRLIANQTNVEPVIYAFSDDPAWVQENLRLPFEVRVVAHNRAETSYEDLRLMSACRHHVIANSTFSWWGAWLNPSPDKIVVAPKRWFADPGHNNPDIIPASWHQLEN